MILAQSSECTDKKLRFEAVKLLNMAKWSEPLVQNFNSDLSNLR